jgi:hypothetical protein
MQGCCGLCWHGFGGWAKVATCPVETDAVLAISFRVSWAGEGLSFVTNLVASSSVGLKLPPSAIFALPISAKSALFPSASSYCAGFCLFLGVSGFVACVSMCVFAHRALPMYEIRPSALWGDDEQVSDDEQALISNEGKPLIRLLPQF